VTGLALASRRKQPANLSLSVDRLKFGRQYAKARHTSLSGVVEELLEALEHAWNPKAGSEPPDPLDGLLAGWPDETTQDLRAAQHTARLAR
jgi:hypothetical protein